MNVSAIGIQNLFELFGTLGKAIRNLFGQKVNVKGDVSVSLTIELGSELESLIRDVITDRNSDVEPIVFFQKAVQELISGNEQRLQKLEQLKVADVTLGTEAIWNAESVPEDIREVFGRYTRLYILAASPEEVTDPQLLPVTLTDALRSGSGGADDGGQTLVEKFGGGKIVRPHFESTN